MRAIFRILFVLSLTLFCVACGSGGGGASPVATVPPPPPPPPPPVTTACTGADTFPGFVYEVQSTPTAPAELHLASSDGCQSELIGVLPDFKRGSLHLHLAADGSAGVIVWTEEINNQASVRRLDFTVDNVGNLTLGQPVTILPLVGEEASPGDSLSYFFLDIWGDATHDSLYMSVLRYRNFSSDPNVENSFEAMIYDLNELTGIAATPDVRIFYDQNNGGWQDSMGVDCSVVAFPQFAPTCYGTEGLRFNPSGTRLYSRTDLKDSNNVRWYGAQRIHIDMTSGPNITDWIVSGPELVYTGQGESGDGPPNGMLARPDDDVTLLPSPEYIAVYDRTVGSITERAAILNADQCAADYAPYADGTSAAQSVLWQGCLDNNNFFTGDVPGRPDSWQSPDAFLKSSFQDPGYNINRVYVSGALAGTEQLMVETARFGDSGN